MYTYMNIYIYTYTCVYYSLLGILWDDPPPRNTQASRMESQKLNGLVNDEHPPFPFKTHMFKSIFKVPHGHWNFNRCQAEKIKNWKKWWFFSHPGGWLPNTWKPWTVCLRHLQPGHHQTSGICAIQWRLWSPTTCPCGQIVWRGVLVRRYFMNAQQVVSSKKGLHLLYWELQSQVSLKVFYWIIYWW